MPSVQTNRLDVSQKHSTKNMHRKNMQAQENYSLSLIERLNLKASLQSKPYPRFQSRKRTGQSIYFCQLSSQTLILTSYNFQMRYSHIFYCVSFYIFQAFLCHNFSQRIILQQNCNFPSKYIYIFYRHNIAIFSIPDQFQPRNTFVRRNNRKPIGHCLINNETPRYPLLWEKQTNQPPDSNISTLLLF